MTFTALFGQGEHLVWRQMGLRAVVIFGAAWALLRIAGRRAFSQQTAFDLCIILLLGAVLSRAVVGASPLIGTLAASAVLVGLHRLIGWLASRHAYIDRIVGGERIDLLNAGKLDPMAMRRAMVSGEDLKASLRATLQCESFSEIDRIVVERNGNVTFVKTQTTDAGSTEMDHTAYLEEDQQVDPGEQEWKTHTR